MPVRKNKKASQSASILKSLSSLQKKKLEVGHFSSDGTHSSGKSYVELMILWAFGGPNGDAVKYPLALLGMNFHELSTKPEFKVAIKNYVLNLMSSQSDEELLNSLGKFIEKEYKDLFGKPAGSLMVGSPSNRLSPLLDTGELRDKVNYKIKNKGA